VEAISPDEGSAEVRLRYCSICREDPKKRTRNYEGDDASSIVAEGNWPRLPEVAHVVCGRSL
jgi:hypothetical protein